MTFTETLLALFIGGGAITCGNGLINFLQDTAMKTAANDMVHYLSLARSEAITRQVPVSVCPSFDLQQCAQTDANYTSWRTGWIVYADLNQNDRMDRGELLRVYKPAMGDFHLRSSRARPRVTYQPTGTAGGSTITLALCHYRDKSLARYVTVSNTGRPRVSRTTDSDMRCRYT